MTHNNKQSAFTIVELVISVTIIALMTAGLASLFLSLVSSTVLAKQRAVANTLGLNQIEHLKSLSYDNLAVAGGSIIAPAYIPASFQKMLNGINYRIETSISYADDAYDGCGAYPNQTLKLRYCRNYPPPSGAPATDTNPADYKLAMVVVKNPNNLRLVTFETQISARVSETASMTGALFVTVADPSGTGISDATVTVTNPTLAPTINASDVTDSNGTAIFYGLPPDNQQDYKISINKAGYSSLTTIVPSGSLLPTYSNQKIISQQASYITLVIAPMRTHSLVLETTDTSGTALNNAVIYVKGGYKKYTLATDASYYYDTLTPTDTRPISDASGLAALDNLPPINSYIFCGTNGAQNCTRNGNTLYLAAAIPYGGSNSLSPITIPPYDNSLPSAFSYNSVLYVQKVRLLLTSNSAFPRVFSITPDTINLSDNLQNVKLTITGYNLAGATATLQQSTNTYTDNNCPGNSSQITCSYNLSSITLGDIQVAITNASGTLTLPITPKGGLNVKP